MRGFESVAACFQVIICENIKRQLEKKPEVRMSHGITARSFLRGHVWAQLLSQAAGQIWLAGH